MALPVMGEGAGAPKGAAPGGWHASPIQPGAHDTYLPGYDASTPPGIHGNPFMNHAIADKQKMLNRVRRLRGQVDAMERAIEEDSGCSEVMHLLTAARGAINGLMAEVIEDHVHMHMIDTERKPSRSEARAAEELIDVLRSYIR